MTPEFSLKVGKQLYQRRHVTICNLASSIASWYTEVIEPPIMCRNIQLYVVITEALTVGEELLVSVMGGNDAVVGDGFNLWTFGVPVHTPVEPYGSTAQTVINFGPEFTDANDATNKLIWRKAIVPAQFRIWFRPKVANRPYSYKAGLNVS